MNTAAQAYIEFNSDFDTTVTIKHGDVDYTPTPMTGVTRMMFERVGDEVAKRATSCVRYEPDSYFDWHQHARGEEYLVLDGTFSDQKGHFSKGWYVRNPPASRHKPFSVGGTEIFVKLAQLPFDETAFVEMDTNAATWSEIDSKESMLELYNSPYEQTSLHRYGAGFRAEDLRFTDVFEVFVVDGAITVNGVDYPDHSWIRIAAGEAINLHSSLGATVYRKIGKGFVHF